MTVDIHDYSRDGAARGWGAGWPSCAGAAGNLATVTTARSGVRVSVHKRIAVLAGLLLDETERRGYLMRAGQTGAFNCRPIAGTSVASNHSWGLAIDINWQLNPYTQPRQTDMPPWMPLLWNRYGFAWGGNYSNDGRTGKADSMHYEFMGTPADADEMTRLAQTELAAGGDDVSWTHDEGAPTVPDYYKGDRAMTEPLPDPLQALAWAAANAGFARTDSHNALATALRVEAKLDALTSRVGAAPGSGPVALSDADVQRVAAAVIALLGRKASAP